MGNIDKCVKTLYNFLRYYSIFTHIGTQICLFVGYQTESFKEGIALFNTIITFTFFQLFLLYFALFTAVGVSVCFIAIYLKCEAEVCVQIMIETKVCPYF